MAAEVTRRHREYVIKAYGASWGEVGRLTERWLETGDVHYRVPDIADAMAQQFAEIEGAALASRHALEPMGAAEIEHLEYGARFLAGMLRRAEADGRLVPEAIAWLEAERQRKAGK